ncbi:MAG: ABC transporter substrate-binding protein [Actinomycetota bacterium]
MIRRRPAASRRRILGLALAVCVLAAGCRGGSDEAGPGSARSTSSVSPAQPSAQSGAARSTTTTRPSRPKGGSARVGVWGEPDPGAATLGGAAVRALVLPQLFVAGPGGRWEPSLVAPGSDGQAADARSATIRFRRGAVWSDGSAISADDLRRSADPRFVAGVDGPAPDGTITLRFTQPLPGWRRLWSGTDAVTAPGPGVWGGPFVLGSHVPGLEAVLKANERWYRGRPHLDEVRLVLVPDPVTARQLLARGELDVVMPPAATVRTRQLEAIKGVSVDAKPRSGWWVGLLTRPDRLGPDARRALAASVDRDAFVGTLLRGEASVLNGFGAAGAGAGAWAGVKAGDPAGLRGVTVDLVGEVEEPMTATLQRSMQKRAHPAGGRLELRNAEADRVERWLAEGSYQAAIVLQFDGPQPCWTCRWASVDEALARAADAGDPAGVQALEVKLRDEALVLPLWRPTAVVAWRNGLEGVEANGYALSGAWNAWDWWRDR